MISEKKLLPGTDWVDRLRWWHLTALFLVLVVPGLGSMPLFEPDEGRYAEIPREMLRSGDFVTPRLNGVLYFEKPALYYWLTAASIRLFGASEFGTRLPSLAAGLAGLLLTFFLGRSLGGHRVAIYGMVALATSPMWMAFSRINSIDMTLAALVTATLAAFWWAHRRSEGAGWAWHATFAASALAVLTKGLIGVVIPGAVIFFYLLLTRGWRVLARAPWVSGTLVFSAIAVPWHVLTAYRNPDFLWFYFIHEHLLRYTTEVHARPGPVWYFVPVVIVAILPWSGFLPAAARLFSRRQNTDRRSELIFLGVWAGFIFLFFSASSSKLVPYILPALPPLALIVSLVVADVERRERLRRMVRWGLFASALLVLTLFAALLWLATGHGEDLLHGIPGSHPSLALACLAGMAIVLDALRRLWRGFSPTGLLTLAMTGGALCECFVLAAFPVAEVRTTKSLADCLRRQPAAPDLSLAAYGTYPQTLPFYLGQKIDVAGYSGELGFGVSRLPLAERQRRYPTVQQLLRRWNDGALTYLVTERRLMARMEQDGLRPGNVLLEARKYVLLANRTTPAGVVVRCHPVSGAPRYLDEKRPREEVSVEKPEEEVAAGGFDVDQRSLREFLDWVVQEGGWELRFADPSIVDLAPTIIVHGSIEGLTPTEASDVVLPASGLTYRIEGDVYLVTDLKNVSHGD